MKPTNCNAQGDFEDIIFFGMLVLVSIAMILLLYYLVLIAMILLTENKVLIALIRLTKNEEVQIVILGVAYVMIVWNIIASYEKNQRR